MTAEIIDNKTIHVFDKSQFDWYAIRNCGQIFRDPPCGIIDEKDKIIIRASGDKDAKQLWDYFDFDTDYNEIKKELSQFKALQEPVKAGGGIRILRQPFIETVICFIISANNNIKRFTKTIAQIDFGNLEKYTESDFTSMGCGYRAPYLVKAVRQLKGLEFETLEKLPNGSLAKELQAITGVGPKVAACVMLFCFHRLDTAPVDVWIRKAIEQLGADADGIFGHRYAGVAQQYIFYYLQHLRNSLT